MPMIPDFFASECHTRSAHASLFHIIPAPMEQSVSYGSGTASGPEAILIASQQMEDWDGASYPLDLGIHTCPFVDCQGSAEEVIGRIEAVALRVLRQDKIPVVLGGEHTVTLGPLQAIASYVRAPVGLIQIDAHADLRDSYEGSRYSHACVARRAVDDLQMPLFQFGVRALSSEEQRFREHHPNIHFLDATSIFLHEVGKNPLPPDFPQLVYLTFDVDGLDPAVIRATGTPVPGGPSWFQAIHFIERALQGRRVLGFDVVELAPDPADHASSFAAALLTYSIMGIIQRGKNYAFSVI